MVQKNSLGKIIIICGPTASSKTALAIKCAKMLNSEVVSADSMYIYKNLNIGTAKPDAVEMDGVKHHLIDVVSPFESFTVSDYKALARPIIDELLSKGKTPIICGGTGFYIDSIIYDFSYGNGNSNPEIREKFKKLAEEQGNEYVFNHLIDVDPESAKKLHYNDVKRVIRALEIFYNGTKKSDIKDDLTPKYDYNAYTVSFDRETLYDRINRRVDIMFENGLLDEVMALIDSGITNEHQCMQGIGYKEVFLYLKGEIDLDALKELIKINSRHYAKRQITYFKRLNNLKYLIPSSIDEMAKQIIGEL